jgi:hypothetical protein
VVEVDSRNTHGLLKIDASAVVESMYGIAAEFVPEPLWLLRRPVGMSQTVAA